MEWTSVWSALAATASAFAAGFVAVRDWVPGRVRAVNPTCYWVGYHYPPGYPTDVEEPPRPALALLVAVQNVRGVSSLVRDLFVMTQNEIWARPFRLQPEFQVEIEDAVPTHWEPVQLFTPIGVRERAVIARVVIFVHRAFRDDPPLLWARGQYTVRGFDPKYYKRELFTLRFELEDQISPDDLSKLPVTALDNIRLTPRRWAADVLERRDHLGRTVQHCRCRRS